MAAISVLCLSYCSTSDSDEKAEEPKVIALLEPAAGKTFKLDDSITFVIECDYSKFGGAISISYSPDSAKTWSLIKTFARKSDKARETLVWHPADEAADVFQVGQGLMFKVVDYNKIYIAQSGYFFFTN
jgi:hypothetical protein